MTDERSVKGLLSSIITTISRDTGTTIKQETIQVADAGINLDPFIEMMIEKYKDWKVKKGA